MKYKIPSIIVVLCSILCIYFMVTGNMGIYYEKKIANEVLNLENNKKEEGTIKTSGINGGEIDKNLRKNKFAIESKQIKRKFTDEEKERVLVISEELAAKDFSRAWQCLEKNDSEATIELLQLLNYRLSEKSFDKIKEALSESIDFNTTKH